ncbi:MAG TPA: hypothetical protein GXX42_10610 [Petrimonas sp.]|uniref:hypothetical protein n=1 Tax=Petrimonas sp. TaxID=2023866 RepID=UPI0017745707|nr:hypothetical protein [Petrimonas sp.]MEA4979025.1 hypothetical protein [Petrimonas sp.]MEA5045629.1 hypothetical protein [Petrimonas sp.]MEA5062443.1 hypothetical protein [Petrimonas sp.]HHV86244.1 hypothetical protein [Petrimonas sp.]
MNLTGRNERNDSGERPADPLDRWYAVGAGSKISGAFFLFLKGHPVLLKTSGELPFRTPLPDKTCFKKKFKIEDRIDHRNRCLNHSPDSPLQKGIRRVVAFLSASW